jgi:hypothetical protein
LTEAFLLVPCDQNMILTILPVAGLHCMPKVIRGSHGNLCSVHLVELRGTGEVFAMKAMDKSVMLNRNKVRYCVI